MYKFSSSRDIGYVVQDRKDSTDHYEKRSVSILNLCLIVHGTINVLQYAQNEHNSRIT